MDRQKSNRQASNCAEQFCGCRYQNGKANIGQGFRGITDPVPLFSLHLVLSTHSTLLTMTPDELSSRGKCAPLLPAACARLSNMLRAADSSSWRPPDPGAPGVGGSWCHAHAHIGTGVG